MNEQLTQRVVNDLGRHRSRNEIVRMVCEEGSLEWPRAEAFVKQIETDHAHTIARKQSPLLIFLCVCSVLMGIALLYLGVDYIWGYFRGEAMQQLLNARTGIYRIGGGLTGIGMIVGGLVGLYNTFERFFES